MANSRLNKHLSEKQLNVLKEQVLAEKERIFNKLSSQQSQSTSVKIDSGRDEVDSANDDILRKTELRFATRESLYFKKLNKTLELMETEEYGMCEDCATGINFTRLKARPTSTMCITCKEEAERNEMQSYHGRISKSLGNSVQFKLS